MNRVQQSWYTRRIRTLTTRLEMVTAWNQRVIESSWTATYTAVVEAVRGPVARLDESR